MPYMLLSITAPRRVPGTERRGSPSSSGSPWTTPATAAACAVGRGGAQPQRKPDDGGAGCSGLSGSPGGGSASWKPSGDVSFGASA